MRLIDADTLRNDWLQNGQNEYVYDTNAFLESIDNAPTVDAVEVVRCKDCKYYGSGVCWNESFTGYCSYAVRKDGE